jgi:hypothetical protein
MGFQNWRRTYGLCLERSIAATISVRSRGYVVASVSARSRVPFGDGDTVATTIVALGGGEAPKGDPLPQINPSFSQMNCVRCSVIDYSL